ncbi:Hypothetical protein ABZS17G119_04018 [Kosakonia cowanii]
MCGGGGTILRHALYSRLSCRWDGACHPIFICSTLNNSGCRKATSERIPRSLHK